jgi:benzil reductase ((S)-benzoin forming)
MIIITGTSSGIGKALANFYLEKGEKVVGISRRSTIKHENYRHIECDLSDIDAVKSIDLSRIIKAQLEPTTLINNAGTIGVIGRTWDLDTDHFLKVGNLNIVAVQSLCAHVIKLAGFEQVEAIVNISSGAGRRPIASWSAYCASKAAVDLFSETLLAELKEVGASTRVYSVAPGVVDTGMQEVIRSSNPEDFSIHQNFVDLKEQDGLRKPEEVATLIYALLNKETQQEVVCRL